MVSKSLSLFDNFNSLTPYSVGYDSIFDRLNNAIESGHGTNYPPYNIKKKSDYLYEIELAVAGFGKKDIDVTYENNMLTIKSVKDEQEKEVEDNDGVLHKGIAKRHFSRTFTIADDVEIKDAELKDGLLKVFLKRIVPEGKEARQIKIN